MNYPSPKNNPHCQCADNPLKAFWCQTGHMMECHYPMDCREAACGHLIRYDFTPQDVTQLENDLKTRIAAGLVTEYMLSEDGQILPAREVKL